MRKVWLAPMLLFVACASASCASTPIKKADVPALAAADALVLQGCYDCLLEARATYARVGVAKARPLVVARLFETDVLITLREKELALDSSKSFTEAQAVGRELPPAFEAARILAIVEAVPGDDLGWTHKETADFRRAHIPFVPKINDELEWLKTGTLSAPVRSYLSLAIDCAYPTRVRPGGQTRFTRPEVPDGAPPLVAYRTGICFEVSSPILAKVREDVPRFVETGFFLSRRALLAFKTEGGGSARTWLDENYKRFPESPSVTYVSGNFNQLVGDCKAGLKFYEETLVRRPEHELALLGRTICLTFLKRTDDAIAEATHMIDLKTDNIDEAYYWRSWNHYTRKELDLARADINLAKSRRANPQVYTLAGMIEHDQTDLNEAEIDLKAGRDMSSQNCTAMWYLGLVALKREEWLASGKNFEDAMICYEANVKDSETGLRAMQNRTNVDPEFKANQIKGFEAAIEEDHGHQYAAAFNAANQYAHGGEVAKAKALLEVAERDPALAPQVAELRKIIGGEVK